MYVCMYVCMLYTDDVQLLYLINSFMSKYTIKTHQDFKFMYVCLYVCMCVCVYVLNIYSIYLYAYRTSNKKLPYSVLYSPTTSEGRSWSGRRSLGRFLLRRERIYATMWTRFAISVQSKWNRCLPLLVCMYVCMYMYVYIILVSQNLSMYVLFLLYAMFIHL